MLPLRIVALDIAGHVVVNDLAGGAVDCFVADHPGEDRRRAGGAPDVRLRD